MVAGSICLIGTKFVKVNRVRRVGQFCTRLDFYLTNSKQPTSASLYLWLRSVSNGKLHVLLDKLKVDGAVFSSSQTASVGPVI